MYIQLHGQVLCYEKSGEGTPIIFLHGNGETHAIWDELRDPLNSSHTTYAIDSRGQGESATPKEFHYADMADDVVHFIEALDIHRPILCGFSDGAIIALLVALSHQDLLSGIVLCGANLSPKGLTHAARREIKSYYKKNPSPLVAMMLEEPNISADALRAITLPALVCAGEKDMIREKETRLIAENLANSTLRIFENATHGSYVEHSVELLPVLKDWMCRI